MHLFVIVRGNKPMVRQWENDLLARYLPYEQDGKKLALQMGVRPVRLYEICYPEAQHEQVMQLIQPLDHEKRYPRLRAIFRRALGLKRVEIPKYISGQLWQQIHRHVDVELLGCKSDRKERKVIETEMI